MAVKTGRGEAIRSEVFSFAVAQAAETDTRASGLIIPESPIQDKTKSYLSWVLVLIGVGLLGLVGLVIYWSRRRLVNNITLPPETPQ